MSNHLIIRPMREADLPAVGIVEQGVSPSWSAAQLASEMRISSGLRLIAANDAEVIGYCAFRTVALEAELLRLAVLPEHRRQGIAGRLIRKAFHRLAERGAATCFLEVRKSNLAAISLYVELGFARIGRRRHYYRHPPEDAVLMRNNIENILKGSQV